MSDQLDTDEGTLHHVSPYSGPLKHLLDYMPSTIPVDGDFKWSARRDDHYGWILCNGRTLSQEEAPKLFEVIGFTYGEYGDRFRLPDPRGRVVGAADGDTHPLGHTVGAELISLGESELPSHTHTGSTTTDGLHSHYYQDVVSAEPGAATCVYPTSDGGETPVYRTDAGSVSTDVDTVVSTTDAGSHTHTFTTEAVGSGSAFSIVQPTFFLGNLFIFSSDIADLYFYDKMCHCGGMPYIPIGQ